MESGVGIGVPRSPGFGPESELTESRFLLMLESEMEFHKK